ncbi:MAG: TolC family protein [Bryobacterales bacterium]|nr:TolC family protein [Bryobacterales bacterium]
MRQITAWIVILFSCLASAGAADTGNLGNSPRVEKLLRAGKLYLSLEEAIALGIENNLDVEFQRLNLGVAATERLRAQAGGVTRGLNYTLAEAPAGVGGPSSALLISSAAQRALPGATVSTNPLETGALGQIQSNLSLLGNVPLSSGAALPNLDPYVSARTLLQHASAPQTSSNLAGTPNLVTQNFTAGGGFRQSFASGAQVGLNFDNFRQVTNSVRSAYSPYTTSALSLTLTQPLLRGFGLRVNRRYQRIAENERQIVDLLFRQQLINTVYGVTRLYYDFVALLEDLKVKQQTLQLSEKLFTDTRAFVEEGTLASVELARANAQVFSARLDLERSRALFEEQQAVLKNVLTRSGSADPSVRSAEVIPTTPLDPGELPTPKLEELFDIALANRADISQAALQLLNGEISLEGARNAVKPQLDLVASAQNNALAGQANPVAASLDPTYLGGYGSALAQIFRRNYPTYAADIQFDLPLRNRLAQADLARDEIQVRQTGIRLQQLRNQARLEVEDAFIALSRARSAYGAAVEARRFQEESLQVEQAKFEVGASTSYLLVQFQSQVAQARSAEVATRSAVAKARAALARATGTILEQNRISIEAARQGTL